MTNSRTTKRQVIESLLENEALTDGLCDVEALVLNQWCLDRINSFVSTPEQSLEDYAQWLTQQARTICRITAHIQETAERARIERRLRRLTDDTAQQAAFLHLLDEHRPVHDYLHALCQIAAR